MLRTARLRHLHLPIWNEILNSSTPTFTMQPLHPPIPTSPLAISRPSASVPPPRPPQHGAPSSARIRVGDFASSWHVHSASLGLILDEIDVSGGATTMDVSVHPLLVPFSENQATWSSASWSGAGLVAGVDYDGTPIDVVTITTSSAAGSRVWFDLARAGMALDAVHGWVLVGSPGVGSMEVVFHSSEAQSSLRPQMLVNYTEVDRTVLSASGWTGTPTPTADDVVAFVATTLDDSGSSIPVPVTWEVTNGTIDDQGRFDAGPAGTTTVTACYGVICDAMTSSHLSARDPHGHHG